MKLVPNFPFYPLDGAVSRVKSEKEDDIAEFDVKNLSPGAPAWANYVKVIHSRNQIPFKKSFFISGLATKREGGV